MEYSRMSAESEKNFAEEDEVVTTKSKKTPNNKNKSNSNRGNVLSSASYAPLTPPGSAMPPPPPAPSAAMSSTMLEESLSVPQSAMMSLDEFSARVNNSDEEQIVTKASAQQLSSVKRHQSSFGVASRVANWFSKKKKGTESEHSQQRLDSQPQKKSSNAEYVDATSTWGSVGPGSASELKRRNPHKVQQQSHYAAEPSDDEDQVVAQSSSRKGGGAYGKKESEISKRPAPPKKSYEYAYSDQNDDDETPYLEMDMEEESAMNDFPTYRSAAANASSEDEESEASFADAQPQARRDSFSPQRYGSMEDLSDNANFTQRRMNRASYNRQPATNAMNRKKPSSSGAAMTQQVAYPKYNILRNEKLGSGSYGSVYKAFDTKEGSHVAMKECMINGSSAFVKALEVEFKTLQQLSHVNIVKVFEYRVSEADKTAQIFMEWMSSGSVLGIIEQSKFRLHEQLIRRYLMAALDGLTYLHENKVLHRDVKPANMLVDCDGIIKLSDFGTSKMVDDSDTASTTNHVVGTCAYLAPEVFTTGLHSPGSDLWALGCSVVEMATGRPPWYEAPQRGKTPVMNGHQLMFRIASAKPPNHHPEVPSHLSPGLREVLEVLMAHKVGNRRSAADIRRMAYFTAPAIEGSEKLTEYRFAMERHQAEQKLGSAAAGAGSSKGGSSSFPQSSNSAGGGLSSRYGSDSVSGSGGQGYANTFGATNTFGTGELPLDLMTGTSTTGAPERLQQQDAPKQQQDLDDHAGESNSSSYPMSDDDRPQRALSVSAPAGWNDSASGKSDDDASSSPGGGGSSDDAPEGWDRGVVENDEEEHLPEVGGGFLPETQSSYSSAPRRAPPRPEASSWLADGYGDDDDDPFASDREEELGN